MEEAKVVVDAAIANLETDPSMVLWPYAQHLMVLVTRRSSRQTMGRRRHCPMLSRLLRGELLERASYWPGFPGAPKGYLRNRTTNASSIRPSPSRTTWGDLGRRVLDIRKAAGQRAGDRIVFAYWKSLRPADVADRTGAAAARRLVEAVQQAEGGKYTTVVRDTLQARDLKF